MARIYGLNGVLRGRQGNNVFSVQNGTQIVKAYQPAVSNPRTFLQSVQRSKFALAGKMSAIVPSGAIIGLARGNKRDRRARFVRLLSKAATTLSTPSGQGVVITPKIDYSNIRFSEGSLVRYSIMARPTIAWNGNSGYFSLSVTCNGFSVNQPAANAPAGYGELCICCLFDATTGHLDACQYAIREQAATVFEFRTVQKMDCYVVVYVAPYAPIDGVSSFGAEGYLGGDASAVSLEMISETFLSGMRWGDSTLLWTLAVTAAQTQTSPSPDDDNR